MTGVRWALPVAAAILAGFGAGSSVRPQDAQQRIYVGPNIRVSTDSEKSHFEPMIASAGSNVFVASANIGGGDGNREITKAYVSRDGGGTWFSVTFPELVSSDHPDVLISGDATVAAGARGRLFFASLGVPPGVKGFAFVTYFYHSDDRGHSWPSRRILAITDHECILTDPARNLVVVAGWAVGTSPRLVMYISYTNGNTFEKPLIYAAGQLQDDYVSELEDGSIFLPFDSPVVHGSTFAEAVIVHPLSRRVSKPFRLKLVKQPPIATFIARNEEGEYGTGGGLFLSHGNTIYAVQAAARGKADRIVVLRSNDEGHTWSAPRYVTPPGAADGSQFSPAAAFNARGVLGIAWSQMVDPRSYDERFTASLDGGRTFLPARIVSTRDSMPYNDENISGIISGTSTQGFSQFSGFTERTSGGDYFGLAADPDGNFHPVWIDSRDGVGAQVYTATIGVRANAPACSSSTPGGVTDVTRDLQLVFDPTRADVERNDMTFPVRIKNIGAAAITGPVTFTITSLQTDQNLPKRFHDGPRVANASNGKTGVGATLDFSGTFGDFETLAPQAVSNPVDVRMRLNKIFFGSPVIAGTFTGRRCGVLP